MRLNLHKYLFLAIVLFFLHGCGGGSDSTPSSTLSNETNNNDLIKPLPRSLSENLNVGFGGRNAYAFTQENSDNPVWVNSVSLMLNENIAEEGYLQTIKEFNPDNFTILQKYLVKSKYIAYWITEGWDESWFSLSKIQEAMDAGYVPVFIYLYFGDKLNALPTGETLSNYHKDNERVAQFLQQLKGTKLFIMEPEFNKDAIMESSSTKQAFAMIIEQGIETIEQNVSDIYFSLCITDRGRRGVEEVSSSCGYENCALGDVYAWAETDEIYTLLKDKLSFISFQQMVSQFSRNPNNPGTWSRPNAIAFEEEEIGIEYLDQRVVNLSGYLYTTHNKPVFLPYLSLPTATWSDWNADGNISVEEIDNEGWRHIPEEVYGGLQEQREALKENGLFGYLPMALFDNPRQDYGGYQHFLNNEYHFGLIQSSAEDETDKYLYGDIEFKGEVLEKIFGGL